MDVKEFGWNRSLELSEEVQLKRVDGKDKAVCCRSDD